MNRHIWLVAVGLLIGFASEGRAQTVGDRVGEGLDNAGRGVRRGFQTAGQAVRGGVNNARASVANMEVVNRIYSRLHWDKALATSTLDVEVRAGGIVVLTGVTPDKAAKSKALTLTADTVGVIQVVDQVAIAAPGSATGTATIVPGAKPTVIEAPATVIIDTKPAEVITVPPPRR